jgi:glycosyltransferase involved in cell wall biosynthesis
MTLISVGITCYNAAASVANAVYSAQAQTWSPIEIVVVDDCSTDDSWRVLERIASTDTRIRTFRHARNEGVAHARNTILERATGEFIAFFDDDDVSLPHRLAEQHRRITEYERATGATLVACYCATQRVYPDGVEEYSPALGMDATPAAAGDDVARLILIGKPARTGPGLGPASALMARRAVFAAVEGFDTRLRRHEDTDFNLRLALRGAHFAGLSAALVIQSMTSGADKNLDAERESAIAFVEKHKDVLSRWSWYDFSRAWCEMKFAWLEGGLPAALPRAARLVLTAPVKTMRKVAWALPNRNRYRRLRGENVRASRP